MATRTGTETHFATLLQDFVSEQVEASTLCRQAARALETTPARDVLADLAGLHERDLHRLRELAAEFGVEVPEHGTLHEARTLGRLRLACRREDERGVIAVVHDSEDRLGAAYERALRNTTLPDTYRPFFEATSRALRRELRRLDEMEGVAA